ncbi:hypothetical protein [Winogradskyella forsetii]|uniref:hypothetical protein n=1 Tax=Winogradskyella forsetii TaxID=2686077 RepID=UPI0015C0482A|nr:hypothetical protein [Winogradskyella forsetii]
MSLKAADLENIFKRFHIDYKTPGFYDSQEFLFQEQRDHSFLEKYAEYINAQTYSSTYLERASGEIPFIARILNQELVKDGRLGACIDVSMVLSRILEREGFWNYTTKGSLTITFPKDSGLENKYFWTVDTGTHSAGHSWVVAPPFTVVDLTLKQQPYSQNEQKLISDYICSTQKTETSIDELDVISPSILLDAKLQGFKGNKLKFVGTNFLNISERFPALQIEKENNFYKYVTVAISASEDPLETITTLKLSNRIGIEIYNDLILPELLKLRASK